MVRNIITIQDITEYDRLIRIMLFT